ncbi:hypothetical protein [Nocardiopsis halophila]|uniref:hypothetical protein n=1 Tax=Nocardiopsis halophila TaxID=141692 RepID=UPI000349DAB7|nr:hypothetical protein [Nocardiopsis halophila]
MESTEVLGAVWAGQIESVRLDVLARRVTLSIVVVDGSRPAGEATSAHQLVFHGVSSFHWFDIVEGPWLRVEAAEIYAERLAGGHRVSIWLNDDDNRLVVDTAEATLDGVAVLPRDSADVPAVPAPSPDARPGALGGLWGGRFESLHIDLPAKRASLSLLIEPVGDNPLTGPTSHLIVLQEVSSLRLLAADEAPRGEVFVSTIQGQTTEEGCRLDFFFDPPGDRLEVHSASALADFGKLTL